MVICPPLPRSCVIGGIRRAQTRSRVGGSSDAQSTVEVGGSGGSIRDGVVYVMYVVEADVREDALTRRAQGTRRTSTTTTTTTTVTVGKQRQT